MASSSASKPVKNENRNVSLMPLTPPSFKKTPAWIDLSVSPPPELPKRRTELRETAYSTGQLSSQSYIHAPCESNLAATRNPAYGTGQNGAVRDRSKMPRKRKFRSPSFRTQGGLRRDTPRVMRQHIQDRKRDGTWTLPNTGSQQTMPGPYTPLKGLAASSLPAFGPNHPRTWPKNGQIAGGSLRAQYSTPKHPFDDRKIINQTAVKPRMIRPSQPSRAIRPGSLSTGIDARHNTSDTRFPARSSRDVIANARGSSVHTQTAYASKIARHDEQPTNGDVINANDTTERLLTDNEKISILQLCRKHEQQWLGSIQPSDEDFWLCILIELDAGLRAHFSHWKQLSLSVQLWCCRPSAGKRDAHKQSVQNTNHKNLNHAIDAWDRMVTSRHRLRERVRSAAASGDLTKECLIRKFEVAVPEMLYSIIQSYLEEQRADWENHDVASQLKFGKDQSGERLLLQLAIKVAEAKDGVKNHLGNLMRETGAVRDIIEDLLGGVKNAAMVEQPNPVEAQRTRHQNPTQSREMKQAGGETSNLSENHASIRIIPSIERDREDTSASPRHNTRQVHRLKSMEKAFLEQLRDKKTQGTTPLVSQSYQTSNDAPNGSHALLLSKRKRDEADVQPGISTPKRRLQNSGRTDAATKPALEALSSNTQTPGALGKHKPLLAQKPRNTRQGIGAVAGTVQRDQFPTAVTKSPTSKAQTVCAGRSQLQLGNLPIHPTRIFSTTASSHKKCEPASTARQVGSSNSLGMRDQITTTHHDKWRGSTVEFFQEFTPTEAQQALFRKMKEFENKLERMAGTGAMKTGKFE